MNKLRGIIVDIQSSKEISLVSVDVSGDVFSAIVLEIPATASYLKMGETVDIIFKETEVAIAKGLSGLISMRNRFAGRIERVSIDSILTTISLVYQSTTIVSIISTASAKRLDLKAGDAVEWLVKTNEASLCPTM